MWILDKRFVKLTLTLKFFVEINKIFLIITIGVINFAKK